LILKRDILWSAEQENKQFMLSATEGRLRNIVLCKYNNQKNGGKRK
jgi:hypothetical protein